MDPSLDSTFDLDAIWLFLSTRGLDLALKVLGAIAIWVVGRWLIGIVRAVASRTLLRAGRVDATLSAYLVSFLSVGLTILLILAIFDVFGVQTTSFAALLAGVGLAIGTAWGGLMSHFAAGVFMQVLRPYRVGDHINAGGSDGRVEQLGLFFTTIVTEQNVRTTVGNNKVFASNIENYSALPYRRVDCAAKLPAGMTTPDAIARLQQALAAIPNVIAEPPPEVALLEYAPDASKLVVRPYAHTDHYWQVYFDTQQAIADALSPASKV